jgi:hypothetical protein
MHFLSSFRIICADFIYTVEQAFSDPTGLTGGNWRCRKDKHRQACIKLGPGVLGAQMEMHNSLIAFLFLFSLLSFFSLFLKPYF